MSEGLDREVTLRAGRLLLGRIAFTIYMLMLKGEPVDFYHVQDVLDEVHKDCYGEELDEKLGSDWNIQEYVDFIVDEYKLNSINEIGVGARSVSIRVRPGEEFRIEDRGEVVFVRFDSENERVVAYTGRVAFKCVSKLGYWFIIGLEKDLYYLVTVGLFTGFHYLIYDGVFPVE